MIKMPRNLVLIKLPEEKSAKAGDVMLTDDVKEEFKDRQVNKSFWGEVVATGPKCVDYEVGDRVSYPGYIGNVVEDKEIGEGLHVIVAENDLIIGFGDGSKPVKG